MPEGPEIWSMQQGLLPLEGQKIEVELLFLHKNFLSKKEALHFKGATLHKVLRHGKRLCLATNKGLIVNGAGMSGHWSWREQTIKHDILAVHCAVGSAYYNDVRRFGFARFEPKGTDWVGNLGIDFLDYKYLTGLGRGQRIKDLFSRFGKLPIKQALLDQTAIAGIGNIYASELLWHLQVHPQTPTHKFNRWAGLGRSTYQVLLAAANGKGTRLYRYQNGFKTPWDEPTNGYQLRVYDQEGQPCSRCKTKIIKFVMGGRATYCCPSCQPRIRHG